MNAAHPMTYQVTKHPRKGVRLIAALFCVSGFLLQAPASPVEIKLPPETARLTESPVPGYALAVAHCSTCHSPDYIPMQPPSTRTYWKAAVTKMQKTFGAPIPDSAVDPIVDYLAQTYGKEQSPQSPTPRKK